MVGLAFLDNSVDSGTKAGVVVAMQEKVGKEKPLMCVSIDLKLIQEKTVVDFMNKNFALFKKFNLPKGFFKCLVAYGNTNPASMLHETCR